MTAKDFTALLEKILKGKDVPLPDILRRVETRSLTEAECESLREIVADELALAGLDDSSEPTAYGKQLDELIGWLGTRANSGHSAERENL